MKIFIIIFIFNIVSASAVRLTGFIEDISIGKNNEDHLVKLESGRVIFIDSNSRKIMKNIKAGNAYSLFVNNKNYLQSFNILSSSRTDHHFNVVPKPFEPTVLKDNKQAQNIFFRMRRNYKSSGQCFNRAHIWAFEEFKKYKTKLQKIFIFFTDRYIRLYKFHWWFHVSPMTTVGVYSRVLDRRYTSGPLQIKAWTDIFIKSKKICPVIEYFSDYFLNQNQQHCYLLKSSMYQIIPRDLEKFELYGEGKEYFLKSDLDKAYRDAFL